MTFGQPTRFYGPVNQRQQKADRLVYSLNDILRAITIAANNNEPLSIRLGADIYVDSVISVPAAVTKFQVGGSNSYKFVYTASITALFSLAQPALIAEVSAEARGTEVAASFVTTSGTTHTGLEMRNVKILNTTDLLDPTKQWVQGIITDCAFNDSQTATLANIRSTAGTGVISYYNFSNVKGYYNFIPGFGSGAITVMGCGSIFNTGAYDSSAVSSAVQTVAIACSFGSVTTRVGDTYIGQGLTRIFTYEQDNFDIKTRQLQGNGTTSGATSLTILSYLPTASKSYIFKAHIVGRRTNGADPGQTNTYEITQQFKVSSAGVVTVGGVLSNVSSVDDASWAAAIDTSGGLIRIRSAGAAGQNILWSCYLLVHEV